MSTIGAGFSMSLDGFVAGPGDDISQVFAWMFQGSQDVTVTIGTDELDLKVDEPTAERYVGQGPGAIISGRRTFDVAGAWGGRHPMNVPVVVMTHNPPAEWLNRPDSPFTFVTDGLESALAVAKKLAGDRGVAIGSPDVTRQCIQLGVLDELGIDLVPVLLGEGVRLFEHLGIEPVQLECASVSPAPGVTHLSYHFVK